MKVGKWIGRIGATLVTGLLLVYVKVASGMHAKLDWYRGNEAWDGVDEHREEIKGKLYPGEQVWTSQEVKEWYEYNQRYFNAGRNVKVYVIDRDMLADPMAPTVSEITEYGRDISHYFK